MRRVLSCILVFLTLFACASKEERRDEFFRNGLKLEGEGRYAEARVEARNILKLDPDHTGAYLILARCAMRDQNWREAYGAFQRATELEPENVEALLGVGRIYLLAGETAKAEETSNQVLRIDPASVDGKMLRAGAMLRAKRYEEARAQLSELLAKDPADEDALMALSIIHAEQGRADEAMAVIAKGLALKPDSLTLHFRAATLAADAGRFTEAEGHLLRLKALDPQNRGVHVLLAALYERMGDTSRVEGILRDLLAADPESEEARLRLVEFLARSGLHDQALAVAVEGPKEPTPKLRLAMAGVKLSQGEVATAEADLRALAEDPDAGTAALEALLRLSEIRLQRGDRDGALVDIDELMRRNPADTRGHAARGRILMLLGRHDEALGELRIAVHDAPDNTQAAILLGRAHLALGNSLSAVETLRAALDRNQADEQLRLELAALHARGGNVDAAIGVLQAGAANGGMTPSLLLAMGSIEARRENFTAAENYFLQAAEHPAAEIPARLRIGGLKMAAKDWPGAGAVFEAVLRDHPDASGAAEGVVRTLEMSGASAEALAWAGRRAAARQTDPLAADLLGRTALARKDFAAAEAAFRESQRRAPEWSVPSMRLAGLFMASGRRDAAVAESRAALARKPDSVPEALLLGQLLQMGGQGAEAEDIYRSLLGRNPNILAAANNLAYCIVTDPEASPERLQEALAMASRAAESGDPAALDTLGWVHYRLGDRGEALTHLRKAHEALPQEPSVAYHLAKVLAEEGQAAEAKTMLDTLLKRTTDFPEYAQARALFESI